MGRSILIASIVVSVVVVGGPAYSAFQQQECSTAWSQEVPVDIGSHEFDKDLHSPGNYGLNQWFIYPLEINSNVAWMNPHLLNWNTEAGYDILTLDGGGSDYQFSGNLGTQWWGIKYGYNSGAQYPIEWHSDLSNTEPGGAQWDYIRVQCTDSTQTTIAPIRTLATNTRHDGVFVNDNDVYYFTAYQPPYRQMVITLDVNAASDGPSGEPPDFDLYASTTTSMPDDSNYQWRAYDGNPTATIEGAGEVIVIPTTGFYGRTVYIGVHNFYGQGHFSVRANIPDNNRSLTICTQDQTPAQVMADPDWPNVAETIQRLLVRDLQATNGNMWMSDVRLKLQASGLQTGWSEADQFCDSDSACDWCMTAYGRVDQGMDGCGEQANGGGRVRIPNVHCQGPDSAGSGADSYHDAQYDDPQKMSKRLEHENGHGLGRMLQHSDVGLMLVDQYFAPGPEDAHTVMNDPVDYPAETNIGYSTDFDHCRPLDPQQTWTPVCSQSTSDWYRIQNSGWTSGWTFPDPTKSSQPWMRAQANVWLRNAVTFTAE